MSLINGGHDHDLLRARLDAAKEVPVGTFWSGQEKLARSTEEPAPRWDGDGLTSERIEEVLNEQHGKARA